MIFFAEELRAWGEFGNVIFLENGRNFDGFFGSNSARKTGITGIPSCLFRIKAHSYLLICQSLCFAYVHASIRNWSFYGHFCCDLRHKVGYA